MKNLKKFFFSTLVPSFALVLIICLSLNPISCNSTDANFVGIEILEGDFSVPKFQDFEVLSENALKLSFNKNISLVNANLQDDFGNEIAVLEDKSKSLENNLFFNFQESTQIGKNYTINVLAKDLNENSIMLSVDFLGYNSNPAKMIFSEVRNAYGTAKVNGEQVHKSEFVEFYVLESGNLSGLEVFSASDGNDKKYVFPSVQVQKGDYVTVHMRKIDATEGFDSQGMISELDDDLTLSTHIDSCDSSRDFWSENTKSVFANTDIILLKNSFNNEILDSFCYATSQTSSWPSDFSEILNEVLQSQTWLSGEGSASVNISDAVCSDNITSSACTRSFSRQNVESLAQDFAENPNVKLSNSKSDWLITADKGSGSKKIYGVTPGFKNSSNAFSK